MQPSSKIRRTNSIIIDAANGVVIKRYNNFPLPVTGQVVCDIRSPRTLFGRHRCRVEEQKAKLVMEAGLPLASEYLSFDSKTRPASAVMKYVPCFKSVEDQIRTEVSPDRAYELVAKCAAALYEFHCAGRTSSGFKLTHGDTYIENFVLNNGRAVLFDFEQEYSCEGEDAVRLDRLFFFWHAANLLRECGHLEGERLDMLMDAVTSGYKDFDNRLSGIGMLGRIYFWARFM